jgi:hypothetical protein
VATLEHAFEQATAKRRAAVVARLERSGWAVRFVPPEERRDGCAAVELRRGGKLERLFVGSDEDELVARLELRPSWSAG